MQDLSDLQQGLKVPALVVPDAGNTNGTTTEDASVGEGGSPGVDTGAVGGSSGTSQVSAGQAGMSAGGASGAGGTAEAAAPDTNGGSAGSMSNPSAGASGGPAAGGAAPDSGAVGNPDAGMMDAGPDPFTIPAGAVGVMAVATSAILIDGDLSDWDDVATVTLTEADFFTPGGERPADVTTLTASLRFRYTSTTLFIGVSVTDDAQSCPYSADRIWGGDSVQLGFELPSVDNNKTGYDYDFEFGVAETDSDGLQSYRWHPSTMAGVLDGNFAVTRQGSVTSYEIAIPATELGVANFDTDPGLSGTVVVNDGDIDDGTERSGWLQLAPGLYSPRQHDDFFDFTFF